MMKLAIILMGFVWLTCDTEGNLEPQVAFIKYYGGEGNQAAVDIHVNNDGTIILLGTTITNGQSNIYLVKTDYNGNTLKTTTFGNGAEVARDLEPTFDGNFVVLSKFRSQGIDSVKLLKISSDLVKIDSVTDGFSGKDAFPNTVTAVEQYGQRDFIVTGSTTQVTTESKSIQSIMHLRFSNNLIAYPQVNWQAYTDGGVQEALPISQVGVKTIGLGDNRLYVFGNSNQDKNETILNNSLVYPPLYFLMDSEGVYHGGVTASKIGEFSIYSPTEDYLASATQTSLAVSTVSTSFDNGLGKLVFTRFPIYNDPNIYVGEDVLQLGNYIQTTLSITNKNLEAVKITPMGSNDGYYVVANQIELDNTRNIWISRIDEAGNVLWSSSFGAKENDDRAAGVAELPNGRVMVLGTMDLENQDKLALINLSSNGKLTN